MLKKTGPCVCTLFPSTTPTAAPFCCHFHFPRPCRRPPCATIFNSSSPIYSRFRSRTLDDPHHPRYSRFHQPPLTRFDSRFTCAVACKSRLICELLSLAIPFAGCDSHCIKFACQSLLEACTIVWMLEIWKLIGLRECPSLFYLNFAFFGDFLVSGSAMGTLLRSRECVGFSGCCASVRNAPILVIQVHSPLLLILCVPRDCTPPFYLYSDLFRSLQYIYEDLYCRYPSVCLSSSPRQT